MVKHGIEMAVPKYIIMLAEAAGLRMTPFLNNNIINFTIQVGSLLNSNNLC